MFRAPGRSPASQPPINQAIMARNQQHYVILKSLPSTVAPLIGNEANRAGIGTVHVEIESNVIERVQDSDRFTLAMVSCA